MEVDDRPLPRAPRRQEPGVQPRAVLAGKGDIFCPRYRVDRPVSVRVRVIEELVATLHAGDDEDQCREQHHPQPATTGLARHPLCRMGCCVLHWAKGYPAGPVTHPAAAKLLA